MAPLSPPVVGIGVDLADPGRVDAALTRRPALARRLFTASERSAIERGELARAELFAAKEAVMKALGAGLGGVAFGEIVVGRWNGDLVVELAGRAAGRAAALGVRRWELTVVARGPLVLARAVALGEERNGPGRFETGPSAML